MPSKISYGFILHYVEINKCNINTRGLILNIFTHSCSTIILLSADFKFNVLYKKFLTTSMPNAAMRSALKA